VAETGLQSESGSAYNMAVSVKFSLISVLWQLCSINL